MHAGMIQMKPDRRLPRAPGPDRAQESIFYPQDRAAAPLRHAGAAVGRGAHPPDAHQIAFARAGVPSILVNEGFSWASVAPEEALEIALDWMATRYHSPQDDLSQPIDYEASALHC